MEDTPLAIGPTERLKGPGGVTITDDQGRVTVTVFRFITAVTRGALAAVVNTSAAIPPAGRSPYLRDVGIGNNIDYNV